MDKHERLGLFMRHHAAIRHCKKQGVAQAGRVPGLEPGSRKFESCRPEKLSWWQMIRRLIGI